jgi:hypothetical protein
MLNHLTINWFPLLPGWGIALVSAVLLALIARGSWVMRRKQVPPRWVALLGMLRVAAVLLFAACLLQPVFSYLRHRAQPPELLVLVDTSASMAAADTADGRSRLAGAIDTLRRSKLLDTLGGSYQLKFFGFDRRAYPLEATELDRLEPTGNATDFAASFASAGDLLAAASDDPAASANSRRVLLVSDGQDRGGESFAETASRAGAVVDVLPVGGEPKPPSGAAFVARVQAPSRVLLASETQFLVTAARGDDAAQTYDLTLFEDGREALTQELQFAAGSHERRTTVTYRPTETGLKRYEFSLRRKGASANVESPDRYGVNVQVIDERIEVLVLEDRWRWEFKFFKRVLEEDPSFNLTAMLARGDGAFLQLGEPERRVNLGSFPQSRAELDWFDVMVLGDVRPSRWPAGLAGAVADAVIDGGKSLVVVAGPSVGELAQVPELHTLLPVELSVDSASPIEGPLDVQRTPDGAERGLFADGERATTAALPAVDRIYAPLRKRPAATVLVEAAGKANVAGRLILLAEQPVGRGRVLYVGTDALWKWQTLVAPDDDGRTPYGKFWQQALRALTPARTSAAPLWLSADRSRYAVGDRVTLRTEVPTADGEAPVKPAASIVLPDERRLPLALEPDPTTPDAYVATFDATTPGRYRIAVTAAGESRTSAEATIAVEVTPARGEADDAGVDRAALAEIAVRTGGKVVDPEDRRTWPLPENAPTPGAGPPPTVAERRTVNLWDNFLLVTLLCLVLGGDWLARLLRGYV